MRRGWVCQGNQGLRLGAVGAIGLASAKRLCIHGRTTLQMKSRSVALALALALALAVAVAVAVAVALAVAMQ